MQMLRRSMGACRVVQIDLRYATPEDPFRPFISVGG